MPCETCHEILHFFVWVNDIFQTRLHRIFLSSPFFCYWCICLLIKSLGLCLSFGICWSRLCLMWEVDRVPGFLQSPPAGAVPVLQGRKPARSSCASLHKQRQRNGLDTGGQRRDWAGSPERGFSLQQAQGAVTPDMGPEMKWDCPWSGCRKHTPRRDHRAETGGPSHVHAISSHLLAAHCGAGGRQRTTQGPCLCASVVCTSALEPVAMLYTV